MGVRGPELQYLLFSAARSVLGQNAKYLCPPFYDVCSGGGRGLAPNLVLMYTVSFEVS